MRKEIYRMPRAEALELLAGARYVHVVGPGADGAPVMRTLNAAVLDGALVFHGAPAGEKMALVGARVVVGAEEVVAEVPSYWVDPERACPATTLYRSVQVHGVLERVDDVDAKARALAALMAKYQPEGGHVPVDATHPLYRKAVAGVMVLRVSCEVLDGKAKLAQNRTPVEVARILDGLWRRGRDGDPRAIERIRAANPDAELPPFLCAPTGTTLSVAAEPRDLDGALALVERQYWNEGTPRETLARAHQHSTAWLVARDERSRVIATARALTEIRQHDSETRAIPRA